MTHGRHGAIEQWQSDGAAGRDTQQYYYANGHSIATKGALADNDIDYAYQPLNAQMLGNGPSRFAVPNDGMTLRDVALALWGDSALWYLIAKENGLSENVALNAGQSLVIPEAVTNVRNASDVFKPTNPAEYIAQINPTMPVAPPSGGDDGCGAQEIAITVVAVVAAVASGGAAGAAIGGLKGALVGGATVVGQVEKHLPKIVH